jgi:hypothetical protein
VTSGDHRCTLIFTFISRCSVSRIDIVPVECVRVILVLDNFDYFMRSVSRNDITLTTVCGQVRDLGVIS